MGEGGGRGTCIEEQEGAWWEGGGSGPLWQYGGGEVAAPCSYSNGGTTSVSKF